MTSTQPPSTQSSEATQSGAATQSIAAYLAALRSQLAPITLSEREEILREIAAHIRDAFEAGTPIDTVLDRLGTPSELAAEYRDGQLIRAASRSLSPLTLLRATLRLATKGITGILVFFCALFGYFTGGLLVIAAMVKPFAPSHVGFFRPTTAGTQHDLLGWWIMPLSLFGGALLLILTTVAIRGFLRLSQRVQRSL
jgi:uncharacterized membrane protein